MKPFTFNTETIMPKQPTPEAQLAAMFNQSQGYMIAMRLVMTLLVAGRPVTVAAALELAKEELEPAAFFSHKALFQSVISDVVRSADRLRGQAQS